MAKLEEILLKYNERNTNNLYKVVAVGKYGIRMREDIYSKDLSDDFTKNKVIHKDTITFGMGSTQIDYGIIIDDISYCVSPAYHTFKINIEMISSHYFNNLMQLHNKKMSLLYMITGARQGKSIDLESLLNHKIYLPLINEQNKICNILTKIDILINEKEKEIKLLKKQNVAIFDYIYHKIDIDFTEVILSEIASGFDYGMNSAAIPYDGVNKYIRITDINESDRSYNSENFVSPLERVDEKYIVKENDILVTRTGGSVGKNYLYSSEDGTIYFAGFLIRINVRKEYTKYLFQFMNTHSYWKYITINSARSGQPGINAQELMNLKLKVPTDLVISDNLGNVFEKINMLIKSNENELESYKMLRGNLLEEMLV